MKTPNTPARFLALASAAALLALVPRLSLADTFIFDWWLLSGEFDDNYRDLDNEAVPTKVWGALGTVRNLVPGEFPDTATWLLANYGTLEQPFVEFRLGTDDTSGGSPPAFVLDTGSFSNDPANGVARMTYLPNGGVPVPVVWYCGGENFDGGGHVEQLVATGTVSAIHLEQNPTLGWTGYGEFTLDAEVPALGPVTFTQCPLYTETAGLAGGGGPSYRIPIVIGEIDFDPGAQLDWQTGAPAGQVADATVLNSLGAGYAGEPSGVTRDPGDVFDPDNATLMGGGGVWQFSRDNLPRLGAWFDPPLVSEYRYYCTDALFTGVGLPTGIDTTDHQFELSFSGKKVTVAEGTFFVFPKPVREFKISDIEPVVDSADDQAFPVRLAFSAATASVIIQPDPTEREQGDLLGLGAHFRVGDVVNLDLSFISLLPGETIQVTGLPPGLVFNAGPPPTITGTVLGLGSEAGVEVRVKSGRATVRSHPFDLTVAPYRFEGAYEFLVEDLATNDPVGRLNLTVKGPNRRNPLATYTASVERLGESRRSAKGSFADPGGVLALSVPFNAYRAWPAVTYDVTLAEGTDLFVLLENGPNNPGRGFRLARRGRVPGGNPRVTTAFDLQTPGDRVNRPAGIGWTSGLVKANALVTLKGQLGDARKVSMGLNLSQTDQAVVWIAPYRNKTSFFGGILDIGNLGLHGRGAATEAHAAGLKWMRAADPTEKSYPAGFATEPVNGVVSRWEPAPTADALALSLGLTEDGMTVTHITPPDGVALPERLSLRGRFSLLSVLPSNAVPWKGKAAGKTGQFSGTLTPPSPMARMTVQGAFLQDASFGNLIGAGVVKIPIAGPVRGSYETSGIVLENDSP
ncbi:MAG: hypothetical protein H7A53_06180 [Akkermansiaceae bacterium]|nr:hypothetical protein [Akkermansiaceae bacterium]MCP5550461.1 hypothetical protein [Akkermansiaceae bacterium]